MALRDVTRALVLVGILLRHSESEENTQDLGELHRILEDMDARTGRRDPTVREAAPTPTPAPRTRSR